jgi:hypothetical protein
MQKIRRALLLVCLAATMTSRSNTTNSTIPKIERIALFKNGLGYVTAVGTIPDKSTSIRIGRLPVPTYGTFWLGYGKELRVRQLITSIESIDEPAAAANIDELLRLNAGRRVTLYLSEGEHNLITGVIKPQPMRPPFEPPSPYFMDVRRGPDRPDQQSVMLVETEHGTLALNPGSIYRFEMGGAEPLIMPTNHSKRPTIRMELEKPAPGAQFGVSYLARGITWVPSYRIDLSDDKTAHFSAQAQIVNEMADLEAAQVDLITGYPNIQFPDLPNPVAMSQNLADFLRSLGSGSMEGFRSRFGGQQALTMNGVDNFEVAAAAVPSYSAAAQGQIAEDLFLYPLPKLSLKNGETATIPLFTTDMPYRHLYTWKIPDYVEADSYRQQRPDGKISEEVWHVCRLENCGKVPLTTAVAEFVKDGQFVGQDTCYYTSAGTETSIRINRAMNVHAEQAEVEVERKRNAANFYGYGYDLVKLTGEMKVNNRTDKAIEIEISKELSGELLEKSRAAKDIQTARGLKQVNPRHSLTWSLKIKPGEESKVTYSYQIYIRA